MLFLRQALRCCWTWLVCSSLVLPTGYALASEPSGSDSALASAPRKLVVIAGRPSHPPRMHEFNAGVTLLTRCLKDVEGLEVVPVLNGWPKDESVFEGASAVIFYMDGGGGHEVVQEGRRRLEMVQKWVDSGVGLGFMHFGVEVNPDQAGDEFRRWIGGFYEHMHSCNPIWEPAFTSFPEHPITQGVKPFQVKDEWYFNMRFVNDEPGNEPWEHGAVSFTPILVASPPDAVRDGPYVYPQGPYPHIQANKGRAEAMMWAVERADGGRGFGFTGGHFHDNWSDENFRKVILNAFLWTAKAEVPEGGVVSSLEEGEIDRNLDKK